MQPLYSENDFYDFVLAYGKTSDPDYCRNHKETILSLCNLLYHIDLSDAEQKIWHKYLCKNKKVLASLGVSKEEFTPRLLSTVQEALSFAYRKRTVTPA